MTPFQRIERTAAMTMEHRIVLYQQPAEFFGRFFGGRVPTPQERMLFVEQAVQRMTSLHIYENDTYHVEMNFAPPYVHLDIRRKDEGNCKNWRELQQIKNELVGPEHEAVELFPAESRLVDTANQYHLWVHVSADYRFPFGFDNRCVLEKPVIYERFSVNCTEQPALDGALPTDRVA